LDALVYLSTAVCGCAAIEDTDAKLNRPKAHASEAYALCALSKGLVELAETALLMLAVLCSVGVRLLPKASPAASYVQNQRSCAAADHDSFLLQDISIFDNSVSQIGTSLPRRPPATTVSHLAACCWKYWWQGCTGKA
jgi:hypothetical protein